jgi:hypothetical protein
MSLLTHSDIFYWLVVYLMSLLTHSDIFYWLVVYLMSLLSHIATHVIDLYESLFSNVFNNSHYLYMPLNDRIVNGKSKTVQKRKQPKLKQYPDRGSAVNTATVYGLEDRRRFRVRFPVRSRIVTSPYSPDRLWDSPNLLPNGYQGLFPRGLCGRGVKLTTHQPLPRSRKCGSIRPLPLTSTWHSA